MRSEFSRLVHALDVGVKAPTEDRITLTCGPTQLQLSRDAAYELQYQLAEMLAQLEELEGEARGSETHVCAQCEAATSGANVLPLSIVPRPPTAGV